MNDSYRLGADGIYRCDAFQQFVWQKHGFGTRTSNPAVDVTLKQIHSSTIWNAHRLADREREGDALVSDEIGVCIGVRTADCVCLLMLDAHRRVVAAIHAGWRGTAAGIATKAIERMAADFESKREDIYVAFGPCIRECCYEVGEEMFAPFAGIFPELTWPEKKWRLDLPEANRRQLIACGVPEAQIFDSGLCTACQAEHFFSYRREPANPDRMISAICRLG